MCGLVAMRSESGPVDREALLRAREALRHRGPDGEGLWIAPDRSVGLAHTRLGILDLEGGAQPFASADGRIHLIVNGELYDFERTREDLERHGHRFRTRCDSEVALHLYEEHGLAMLEHLRGEFALVLWDERRRLLFAARDRFGVKPLCYAQRAGTLFVASEAKALFAAGVRAAWDHASFFQAASLHYTLPGRTLFERVFQLEPGHYLLAHGGRVETHRYWDLDYPRADEPSSPLGEREQAGELFRRLDEAVRLRLRADVPVACQLSGGVDSSAVVALAMRHAQEPIACFSVSFEDDAYDELPIAKETAAHVGAIVHPVRVTDAALVESLSDAVFQGEGLAINGHLSAKFLLSRAVRDAGFKVVLTGEGSDEIFGGYAHLRRDLALGESASADRGSSLARLFATNGASAGTMLPSGESLPAGAASRTLGFLPSFLEAKGTFGLRSQALLRDDVLASFAATDPFAELLASVDVEGQLHGRHRVHQSMALWSKLALTGYILRTLGDGMEMAHSIEGRLPFLDGEVVAFARTLPVEALIRGSVEKHVLREAMRPLLPETVRARQKHPFLSPPLSGPRSCIHALMQDALRSAAFARVPFYDRAKVTALLDRLPSLSEGERTATDPVLMMALTASLLQERFGLG